MDQKQSDRKHRCHSCAEMSITRTKRCAVAPQCYVRNVWHAQGLEELPQLDLAVYDLQYQLYGVVSRQDRSGAECAHYVSWLLAAPDQCWFYDCLGLNGPQLHAQLPKHTCTRAVRTLWPPANLVPKRVVYLFYLRV